MGLSIDFFTTTIDLKGGSNLNSRQFIEDPKFLKSFTATSITLSCYYERAGSWKHPRRWKPAYVRIEHS